MGTKTVTSSSADSSKTSSEGTRNPFKPNPSGVHRYIKWVSILTLFVVIVSSVTVFIAYRVMGAKFETDVLTENDIPLAIGGAAVGAGVGMALLSIFSPISFIRGDGDGRATGGLMDEIELPEREDKDKKNKDKNVSSDDAAENRRRQAADEKMRKSRERARKLNTKTNKKNTRVSRKRRRLKASRRLRGLRKAPKGVRFLRGFFRLLFRR